MIYYPSWTIRVISQAKLKFWKALWQALVLNADFYENTRSTRHNRRLALAIVVLATISHVLGSAVILLFNRAPFPILLLALCIDGLSVILGYYFWTLVIWKVGQWLKEIDPTYTDLLGPIGFAYAPQVLNFLTLIPLLGRAIELILALWSLLAVIVAARQGLDITTRRAVILCLMGWAPIQIAIGFVQVLEQNLVKWAT